MKPHAFLALALLASPAFASEPVAEALPHTAGQWAARMMDFTRNLDAFADPRLFMPYANAMTEPAYWFSMAQQMMQPEGAARMMASFLSPGAVQNFMRFAQPQVVADWMQAMMDPAFSSALMAQSFTPEKMARWMSVPADPAWGALGAQAMNPVWPMQWMAAMMQAGIQPFVATPVAGVK